MLPLRQMILKVSAKLINRLLDYVLGPIDVTPAASGAMKVQPKPAPALPRLEVVAQSAPAASPVTTSEKRNPRSEKRVSPRASSATAALPVSKSVKTLRPLDQNLEHEGTVWIPRILWALEWAKLNQAGPRTAADLTKILEEQAGLAVRPNNLARAFRDLKDDSRARDLWTMAEKRYTIAPRGETLLREII
jgi:hypothetical protein